MNSSISKFKNVFIDFKAEVAVTHSKAANGHVLVGSHNAADYHAYYKELHSGQSVHIILCDQQVDGSPRVLLDHKKEFISSTGNINVTKNPENESYILVDPPLSGGKLLISGTWENASSKKHGTLTNDSTKVADNVGLVSYLYEDHVEIKLPKKAAPSIKKPVQVDITVTVASGPWGGDGRTAPHNLIVIDSDDTIHTMCVMHELGHLINLGPLETRVNCPDGFEYNDHTKLYESKGAHCYSGGTVHTDKYGDTIGDNGTCIMYHQLNYDCSLEFCSYCAPFAKAMKLKKFKDLSK